MVALVAQALVLIGVAQIQFTLAPDQPVPHVYSDDPLIVELLSPVDTTCSVDLFIDSPYHRLGRVELGRHALRAGQPLWLPVKVPEELFGPHHVRAVIHEGDISTETEAQFHRIGRPAESASLPLHVAIGTYTEELIYALSSLPIAGVRVDSEREDLVKSVHELKDRLHCRVHVRLAEGEEALATQAVTALANSVSGWVDEWEIEFAQGAARVLELAEAIAMASPEAAIRVIVAAPEELGALLALEGAAGLAGAVIESVESPLTARREFQAVAARMGFERYPVRVTWKASEAPAKDVYTSLRGLIDGLSGVEAGLVLSAGDVFQAGVFEDAYGWLSGTSRVLKQTQYLGSLSLGEGLRGEVFRDWTSPVDGTSWVVALQPEDSSQGMTPISLFGAEVERMTDAFGNSIPFEEREGGDFETALPDSTRYLRGRGGRLLGETASQEMRRAVSAVELEGLVPHIRGDLRVVLDVLSKYEEGVRVRSEFLIVLRSLLEVETLWHEGVVERSVAVPALAELGKIARYLAILEEASGVAFLDPVELTLSNAERILDGVALGSQSGDDSFARARWLQDEVLRLIDEARGLSRFGRSIEAGAIAALAEWRARCLEIAAQTTN